MEGSGIKHATREGREGLVVVGGGRTAAADRRSGNDVAKVQIPIGMHLDSRRGIFIFYN